MSKNISKLCIKRMNGDAKLLKQHPIDNISAYQDKNNPLTWFFLLKGPVDTHYEGGHYLGKIIHSPEYPFKPPDFMMLTPNGRFEINVKICLTNSGYHSSEWSAMWNIRSIILGFLSIMTDDNTSGISHIKRTKTERQNLANNSDSYNQNNYTDIYTELLDIQDATKS